MVGRLGSATLVVCALSFAAALSPAAAGAGPAATIAVGDDVFRPIDATVDLGTAVTWEWQGTSASHNVVEDHALFSSGVPTAVDGTTLTVTPSAGSYHYVCETHTDNGMRGTLHVSPSTSPGSTGRRFDVEWATPGTDTGSVFDVQYRIDRHLWRDWLTDTTEPSATFGRGGVPVGVRAGTRYRFRVRTQGDALDPIAVSLWSPATVVET